MDYEIVGSYYFQKSDSRISIGIVVSRTLLDRVVPIPHPQAAGVKVRVFLVSGCAMPFHPTMTPTA
jgi:hypothetical protein